MSTLASLTRGLQKLGAPRVVELTPGDFASDWERRPVSPVPVGLRLPSDDDVQAARAQATKRVEALDCHDPETATATWNDALMALAVARCLCDPRDVLGQPLVPIDEDNIGAALTPVAIRRLFDELERLQVEQSPLAPEATDEELHALRDAISTGEHVELTGADGRTFRRFARYCLDLLPAPTD